MRLAVSSLIFVAAAAVTSALFINLCATIFQCGCQSIWGAGATYCNIHASHGKHCPWCSFGSRGYMLIFGGMLAAQALASFLPLRWGWGWLARLVAAVAAFPATGLVLGLGLGWYTGYWD